MNRSDLMKYLSIAPLPRAAIRTGVTFQAVAAVAPAKAKRDVIKELGLRR